jgi:hypothetical protein
MRFSTGVQRALHTRLMSEFSPSLRVTEADGRVRLWLDGLAFADGPTLQDAADGLVQKMLVMAMAIRSGQICCSGSELRPDPAVLDYLWRLGQVAAAGEDIRQLLFGPATASL